MYVLTSLWSIKSFAEIQYEKKVPIRNVLAINSLQYFQLLLIIHSSLRLHQCKSIMISMMIMQCRKCTGMTTCCFCYYITSTLFLPFLFCNLYIGIISASATVHIISLYKVIFEFHFILNIDFKTVDK